MNELMDLEGRIRKQLTAANARRQSLRQKGLEEMADLGRRANCFNGKGIDVVETHIRPRLKKLVEMFPNASLLPAEQSRLHQLACAFQRVDRFPATAMLTLGAG